jgi:CheY-like chemotaxis protein
LAKIKRIVLYVEDEDSDRFLMRTAFAHEGFGDALRMVNDGRTAVEYLSGGDLDEQPKPGVVLLDLNLPEMHGFDVLKWIRTHPLHSELPVVVFTSSERGEDRARAKLLGANDFLQKPNSAAGFRRVARMLSELYLGGSALGVAGSAGKPG